jgi:Peptidase family S41
MAVKDVSPVGAAPPLTDLLAAAAPLTLDERRVIVQQAQRMIEQLYVHLPLKRAMHAVDPVQRLRLVERRLESYSDRRFHDEMISIFIGLRDLHTNYILPAPFAGKIAFLPFRIEAFWQGDARRYLVTGVTPDLNAQPFGLGVEVTHWNGIPIDRAVALNGERNGGSNVEARHARGLSSMTQRPMGLLSAPDEEWVDISFVADGAVQQARFPWQVLDPSAAPTAAAPSPHAEPIGGALGLDVLTEEVRRAQKTVLAPDAIELEQTIAAAGVPADQLDTVSTIPDVLQFRRVPSPHADLGYLRIRTFMVGNIEAFLNEVLRILALLPQEGLIIDVRGNGGGIIAAGELLLQLFTPRKVEPERLHFINTPVTFEVTRAGSGFEAWHDSIGEAVETGTPFSDGLPLAERYAELCNSVGQRYYGPVVLITDALCYSTTDIFSAGFQDHNIGPVIGSGNTGAGGANVWTYADVLRSLPTHFKPLPKQASMRVAIRRTTRVGARSGDPLEDLGVVSDIPYKMTRRDLLERNVDLIARAAQELDSMPRRTLAFALTPTDDGVAVAMTTAGLDRLDIHVDERPVATLDVTDGELTENVSLTVGQPHVIEVRGFSAGELAACRKQEVG